MYAIIIIVKANWSRYTLISNQQSVQATVAYTNCWLLSSVECVHCIMLAHLDILAYSSGLSTRKSEIDSWASRSESIYKVFRLTLWYCHCLSYPVIRLCYTMQFIKLFVNIFSKAVSLIVERDDVPGDDGVGLPVTLDSDDALLTLDNDGGFTGNLVDATSVAPDTRLKILSFLPNSWPIGSVVQQALTCIANKIYRML
jgi:hypothetical protein